MNLQTAKPLQERKDRFFYGYTPNGGGKLGFYRRLGSLDFHCEWIKQDSKERIKIVEVICATKLQKLPEGGEAKFFDCHYPRIAPLSDGSYKVYLQGKISGGMPQHNIRELLIADSSISNGELSRRLLENLPPNTFHSVDICDTTHIFDGEEKPAKKFAIKISDECIEDTARQIRLAFTSVPNSGIVFDQLVSGYLVGVPGLHEWVQADWERAEEQVRRLALEEREISIYVSNDGNNVDCVVDQPGGGCVLL